MSCALAFLFLFSPCPVLASLKVLTCTCLHLFNVPLFLSLSVSCPSSPLFSVFPPCPPDSCYPF